MLGKRPRHPMKRTTSMTDIDLDLRSSGTSQMPLQKGPTDSQKPNSEVAVRRQSNAMDPRFMPSAVSPRSHRRSTADFMETASFLRACNLCNRSLGPGRDIYMYRGEIAFCSLECRQQQINHDDRKERCSMESMKKEAASSSVVAGSETSNNGETVVGA